MKILILLQDVQFLLLYSTLVHHFHWALLTGKPLFLVLNGQEGGHKDAS